MLIKVCICHTVRIRQEGVCLRCSVSILKRGKLWLEASVNTGCKVYDVKPAHCVCVTRLGSRAPAVIPHTPTIITTT